MQSLIEHAMFLTFARHFSRHTRLAPWPVSGPSGRQASQRLRYRRLPRAWPRRPRLRMRISWYHWPPAEPPAYNQLLDDNNYRAGGWKVVWHWKWNRMFRLLYFLAQECLIITTTCTSDMHQHVNHNKDKHHDINGERLNFTETHIMFCPGGVIIIFIIRGRSTAPLVAAAQPLQLLPIASS